MPTDESDPHCYGGRMQPDEPEPQAQSDPLPLPAFMERAINRRRFLSVTALTAFGAIAGTEIFVAPPAMADGYRHPFDDFIFGDLYGSRTLDGKPNFHNGIDYFWPSAAGTPFKSVGPGVVEHTGAHSVSDLGNVIVVQHPDGNRSAYCHIQDGGILVSVGQSVTGGQVIGKVGDTGLAYGAHLHLEAWRGATRSGNIFDPLELLAGGPLPHDPLDEGDEMPRLIGINEVGHPNHGRVYLVFPDRYVWVHPAGIGAINAIAKVWGLPLDGAGNYVPTLVGGYEAQWAFNEIDDATTARNAGIASAVAAAT